MPVNADALKIVIARELEHLTDSRVMTHIQSLLVEPRIVLLNWEYGDPGQQYPGWIVLRQKDSETDIVYCQNGFGPRCPWGLVGSASDERQAISMGMDSGWFPTFMRTYFDSFAATQLPIWRVFKTDGQGAREPITAEGSWPAVWELVEKYRQSDPASRYDCDHSICYSGVKPPAVHAPERATNS